MIKLYVDDDHHTRFAVDNNWKKLDNGDVAGERY